MISFLSCDIKICSEKTSFYINMQYLCTSYNSLSANKNRIKILCVILVIVFSSKLITIFIWENFKNLDTLKNIIVTPSKPIIESEIKVCRDIFELGIKNKISGTNLLSQRSSNILKDIFYSKKENNFLYYNYYENLSGLLPSIIINSTI